MGKDKDFQTQQLEKANAKLEKQIEETRRVLESAEKTQKAQKGK